MDDYECGAGCDQAGEISKTAEGAADVLMDHCKTGCLRRGLYLEFAASEGILDKLWG